MTPVELAVLRDRVARARKNMKPPNLDVKPHRRRDWALDKRRWRAKRSVWCVYCGVRIKDPAGRYQRGITCLKHQDLPALDPAYGARFHGEVGLAA